jgi:hypothetical protein
MAYVNNVIGISEEFFSTAGRYVHTSMYYTKIGIDIPLQIVKDLANDGSLTDQGVGPHYDAGFLTFLLVASPHRGMQVQNLSAMDQCSPHPRNVRSEYWKG